LRQHNHFITQSNYKATCFGYRLVILRPILSIVSEDAMHTVGTHRVYIHEIHQIKSYVKPATRIPPQPTHTETPTHIERRTHDRCGDTIEKSQAPGDGCINVRNMLSIEEVK